MQLKFLLNYMVRKYCDGAKLRKGLLILLFCSSLSLELTAKSFAQQVSIEVHNQPLGNVLKQIEKKTAYTFFLQFKRG